MPDSDDIESKQDIDPKFTTVRVKLEKIPFLCVLLSLILGIFLAGLDQTIVSTALKTIVADLGHEELNSWIGSAYMMTSCMFCTLYGKFADIFGRRLTFIAAVTLFELGSLLCGLATSMPMLIVGRALAGTGGGGILSISMIILSDIVSIQDRGKYQGFVGATYAVAAVVGPLVGGAFVDHATWRWSFFVNIPVALFLNFPATPGSFKEKLHRVDFLGSAVLATTIVLLLIPIQLGGNDWAWNSPQTIICLILFVLGTVLFVYIEGKVAEPIIPHALFKTRTVSALACIAFFNGAGFFSSIYYNALFFQVAQGYSATDAGVQAIPFQFGVSFLSIMSGIIVSKTGQYKFFFFVGPAINIVGVALMATMDQSTSIAQKIVYLLIAGIGVGSLNQMSVLAFQASVDAEYMAIITSVQRTFQQLGGSIGLSIIGNILNSQLNARISSKMQEAINATVPLSLTSDPVSVIQYLQNQFPDSPILTELVNAFVASYRMSYFSILVFPAFVFCMAFFVTQYEVKSHKRK
ncbi:hypothetical protein HK100_012692 [Physocladia obscura]|uniref:Major facilitator superfamily (MFS) profile domain-containing protein n=1 Tax=Physocladia obscura TaxID=109957 RepID=A0AAD5T150_9FUNG|nr:hypothetical protein HK100_012692 [Physocladia obscura]